MIIMVPEDDWTRVAPAFASRPDIVPLIVASNGRATFEGQSVAADARAPDALWLTRSVFDGGPVELFLETALTNPAVRWVQTFNAGLDTSFAKMRSYGMRLGERADRLAADIGEDISIFAAMMRDGRRLTNSDSMAPAIGEFVISQIIAAWYPVAAQRAAQQEHRWCQTPFRELAGSRWLILGFGRNGREIGGRAKALGAAVTGVRREAVPDDCADHIVTPAETASILGEQDVVILACPLTAATRNLVDTDFLAAMKPGSILVNIARGGLIDDAALLAALDRGAPRLAILDAFRKEPLMPDDPYWSHPAVWVTAHCAWAGDGVLARNDALFIDNVGRFLANDVLRNEVHPADV